MFNKSYKSQVAMFGSAVLALTVSASSAAFVLVPNGDFETAGGANWGVEMAGGSTFAFPTTGGNTGGYGQMTNSTGGDGWGGVLISPDAAEGASLASLGLTAGQAYDFQFDMICESGTCDNGGIKVESWDANGNIGATTDNFFANNGTWATYNYNYTVNAAATHLKIVMLGIDNNSVYGFDNLGIIGGTQVVPVPAAAWLFGSALAGLVAVRRKK